MLRHWSQLVPKYVSRHPRTLNITSSCVGVYSWTIYTFVRRRREKEKKNKHKEEAVVYLVLGQREKFTGAEMYKYGFKFKITHQTVSARYVYTACSSQVVRWTESGVYIRRRGLQVINNLIYTVRQN